MASDKSEVVLYWNGGRGFGFIAPDVRTAAAARGPLLTQSGRWHFKPIYYHRKT